MKRGLFITYILLVVVCVFSLVACNAVKSDNGGEEKGESVDYSNTKLLFLGDSIAEGIIGVSPEEERVNYASYGILGQINDFYYENRAISGQQTGQMLEFLSTEESDANMPVSHIKTADIICISITGNDVLWHNFPCMLYEKIAKEVIGDDYTTDERVINCYLYNKYSTIDDINGDIHPLVPGDGLKTFEECKIRARANLSGILDKIREYNPKAKIFLQNTYDPVDDESEVIAIDLIEALSALDESYNFKTKESVEKYRQLGFDILGSMSTILNEMATARDEVYFVDVAKAFDEVYRADEQKGKDLIFVDGVHPSNKGHAMIARIYQETFIEMGLAEGVRSLEKYKDLRLSQFDRMYKDEYSLKGNADEFKKNLKAAKSMAEVDDLYFGATDPLTAKLYSDPTKDRVTNGKQVEEKQVYELSDVEMKNASEDIQSVISGMLPTVKKYMTEKTLTLDPDGALEIRLGVDLSSSLIKSLLNSFLGSVDGSVVGAIEDQVYKDENGNLTECKLASALDAYQTIRVYAKELFPGIGFDDGTFGENFSMLFNSLGLNIEGLDSFTKVPYVDNVGLFLDMGENEERDPSTVGKTYSSYVDYLLAYLSRYTLVQDADGRNLHVNKLPDNLSTKIGELKELTIVIKTVYSLVTLTSADGEVYDAVYAGQYHEKTSPFLILTRNLDEDGFGTISFSNQMVGLTVTFEK